VKGEEGHDRYAAEHGVAAEKVPEGAREVAARVDRHAVEEIRQADAPDQRRAEAPDGVRPHPRRAPARALVLLSPLERDHADDQEEENEQQCEVEAREHRPVPRRERGKRRAAGDDEPDLVAVPDRPDRLEHDPSLSLVFRQEREQHPDSEVEALEQEVAAPEHRDQDEPEDLEVHQ
jgi:hypothetical protein